MFICMTATIRTCTKNRAEVKKTMIKPDPCLSLSFYRVRVFQKHCSLVFVCICRLKSCSPPCLLSALEEIVFSRLLEKLTVSSLSQLPITNFLYLNSIIGDIDHVVFVLNQSQQRKKSSKSFASVSGLNSMTL